MKSFLYAGAALMIGASVYGFVDYKKSSRGAELKKLYSGEMKAAAPGEKKEVVIIPAVEKKEPGVKTEKAVIKKTPKKPAVNSTVKKRKKLNHKLFSRAPLREDYLDREIKLEETKESKDKTIVKEL